jgi:hypothetical protein
MLSRKSQVPVRTAVAGNIPANCGGDPSEIKMEKLPENFIFRLACLDYHESSAGLNDT